MLSKRIIACLDVRAAAEPPEKLPAPGRLIDIGGRKLHLLCSNVPGPTTPRYLAGARITTGCGLGNFCPDDVMTRGTMARNSSSCFLKRPGSA